MNLKKSGITATAQEVDGEFTVLEGSGARLAWTGVEGHSYTGLRTKLEQDGTLVPTPDGSAMRFTRSRLRQPECSRGHCGWTQCQWAH